MKATGPGINCGSCGGKTRVVDSRAGVASVRRRRRCVVCGERLTTLEREFLEGDDKAVQLQASIRGLSEARRRMAVEFVALLAGDAG